MASKPKGKMFPKTAAMHAYRLFSLGRINGPAQHPDQMHLPLDVPAETGPRQLPYTLYAVADPDGMIKVPLAELAVMVGMTPRTVERWRDRIRDLGFIEKVSNGNRYVAATYLLIVPGWAVQQMLDRYPDTFHHEPRDDTQGVASSAPESPPIDDTHGVASRPAFEILETTSERLETTLPRSDCRLTEEEGDSLRSSLPPQPPKQRVPSVAAPSGAELARSEPVDFDGFWAVAVRKTGKGTAARAFRQAFRHTTAATLMAAWVQANTAWATWPDKTVVPHPATWLRGQRWRDDPVQPRGRAVTAAGSPSSKWASAMDMLPADESSRRAIEGTP